MPKFPKNGIFCPFLYVKFSEQTKHTNHKSLINCLLIQQSTQTHRTHIFSSTIIQSITTTIHHQINAKQHPAPTNAKAPRRLKCDSTAIVHQLFSQQANLHRTHTEPTPNPLWTLTPHPGKEKRPPPTHKIHIKHRHPFPPLHSNSRFQSSPLPLPSLLTM